MLLQTLASDAHTNAYINKNAIVAIANEVTVAATTTAETENVYWLDENKLYCIRLAKVGI